MRHLDMPVVPLLLALVLGHQLEEHLRVALTESSGDLLVFFQSPFSVLFLSLSIISIVWSFASERRGGRPRSAPAS
jgi:putative tricarboxylic transport membrane protein